jgi:hypothetical protein
LSSIFFHIHPYHKKQNIATSIKLLNKFDESKMILLQNWVAWVEQTLRELFGTPNTTIPSILGRKQDPYCIDSNDIASIERIPTTLLEHLCTFLTDESIVCMTMVCTSLYNEIGHPNAGIWKILLIRHNWPYDHKQIDDGVIIGSYRWQFQQHYSIVRDVKALGKGYDYFMHRQRNTNTINTTNLAIHDNSFYQNSPIDDSHVVVEEWSPRHVLVACSADCTLRLYEARKNTFSQRSSGIVMNDKICHELICYRIDPYQHNQEKKCDIKDTVLDDTYITSLCMIRPKDRRRILGQRISILISIRRDVFLLGESVKGTGKVNCIRADINQPVSQVLQIFNLNEEIYAYMLKEDDCPNRLRTLNVALGEHFIVESVSISSCKSELILVSCNMDIYVGDSRFVEATVGTRIFLICLNKQQIIWSNDCHQLGDNRHLNYNFGLCSSYNRNSVSREHFEFAVASRSPHVDNILVGVVEPSGAVSALDVVKSSPSIREKVMANYGLWKKEDVDFFNRFMLMTLNDIVTAEVWRIFNTASNIWEIGTFISFFPRNCSLSSRRERTSDLNFVKITGNLVVYQLSHFQDTYLVVLCHEMAGSIDFLRRPIDMRTIRTVIVVIHIPSQQEIGQFNLNRVEDQPHSILPKLITKGQGTFGLVMFRNGIAVTGNDIRHHVVSNEEIQNHAVSNDNELGNINPKVNKTYHKRIKG